MRVGVMANCSALSVVRSIAWPIRIQDTTVVLRTATFRSHASRERMRVMRQRHDNLHRCRCEAQAQSEKKLTFL